MFSEYYCGRLPCSYDCWSRKAVGEERLKNDIRIANEYSNDGIDVTYVSASFKYNGSHINCIAEENWAQNLPIASDGKNDYHLCITNTSLMTTFRFKQSDYSSSKPHALLSVLGTINILRNHL